MRARENTLSMIHWWEKAGVNRADLAVRRADGAMLWHRDVFIVDLPLSWARAENTRHGEVYMRPARGYPWPLVFLDDVSIEMALSTARKYDALVVRTSQEGGCHVWLSCCFSLGERARHYAQRWLASRADADISSTSGEHLGRLAGFKNWKRNGAWVNVVEASLRGCRWTPRTEYGEVSLDSAPTRKTAPTASIRPTDNSASGMEWGWVCGMLEAGLPPRQVYFRLVEHARPRRGRDTERYARRTVRKALGRTRPTGLQM